MDGIEFNHLVEIVYSNANTELVSHLDKFNMLILIKVMKDTKFNMKFAIFVSLVCTAFRDRLKKFLIFHLNIIFTFKVFQVLINWPIN